MTDPDQFLYSFVFELGKFYPLAVSLLGGRFFSSYGPLLPVYSADVIDSYKGFLQDNLTKANSLISDSSNESTTKFIRWIINYIEYELVNYNYRNIHLYAFSAHTLMSTFSQVLDHLFTDPLFLEFSTPEKLIQCFFSKNNNLISFLTDIQEKISSLPYYFLLELSYLCDSISLLYINFESSEPGSMIQNQNDYFSLKEKNLAFCESLLTNITTLLENYSFPDLDPSVRKDIFMKSLEYNLKFSLDNFDNKILTISNKIIFTRKNMLEIFNLPLDDKTSIEKIFKNALKTKISSDDILAYTQQYWQDLNTTFSGYSTKFMSQDLVIDFLTTSQSKLVHKPVYVSSQRTKRGSPAKLLLTKESLIIGPLFYNILTEIIPFHSIMEINNSVSFVHQVLLVPETVEGIQLFLASLYLETNFENSLEISSYIFIQINNLLQLALVDVECFQQNISNHSYLSDVIQKRTTINDLSVEIAIQKLQLIPGYYFSVFAIFSSLQDQFTTLKDKLSFELAFEKLFQFITDYYGAPLQLFLQELEKIKEE